MTSSHEQPLGKALVFWQNIYGKSGFYHRVLLQNKSVAQKSLVWWCHFLNDTSKVAWAFLFLLISPACWLADQWQGQGLAVGNPTSIQWGGDLGTLLWIDFDSCCVCLKLALKRQDLLILIACSVECWAVICYSIINNLICIKQWGHCHFCRVFGTSGVPMVALNCLGIVWCRPCHLKSPCVF